MPSSMKCSRPPIGVPFFALIFCFGGAFAAGYARADEVKEALDQAAKRRSEIKAVQYVNVTTMRRGSESDHARQVIHEKRVGDVWKLRAETFQAIDAKGETKADAKPDLLSVFDGKFLWTEFRSEGTATVVKSKVRPDAPIDGIRSLAAEGRARVKEVDFNDEKCLLVEIVEIKNQAIEKASFWIGRKHGVVLKSELTASDGSTTTSEASKVKIDAALDDSLFAYQPPEGSTVMDVTETP
jgi:outer membrane lipoprotein-sorting protein